MGYGFDVTVPAPAGEASVCVAGINVFYAEWDGVHPGLGDHVLFDCRRVTVT